MKKVIRVVFVLLVLLINSSCAKPKDSYPGYEWDVANFKKGVWGLNVYSDPSCSPARLIKLLESNKKLYFKNEQEYKRVQGIFYILSGNLIEGLSLWREYSNETGDTITPRLEMEALSSNAYSMFFQKFLINGVVQEIVSKKNIVPEYPSSLIIWGTSEQAETSFTAWPLWYYDQLTFKKEMKGWQPTWHPKLEELKNLFYKDYTIVVRRMDNPEYYSWLLTLKNENKEYEILIDNSIFLYSFYRGEFAQAYEIGKKYDFEKNKSSYFRNDKLKNFDWMVPDIFYLSGHLDELIPFYESLSDDSTVKDSTHTYSCVPIEYWLAAAFGNQQDFDTAFKYLRIALTKVTLWDNDTQQDDAKETNHLLGVLWQAYMTDSLDSFRKAGKFNEVETLLRTELKKYSYLQWIP